jgi:hypothetical protein
LPTPFQPAMRHRPCRIQAKILSRSRHRKAFQFSKWRQYGGTRSEVIQTL